MPCIFTFPSKNLTLQNKHFFLSECGEKFRPMYKSLTWVREMFDGGTFSINDMQFTVNSVNLWKLRIICSSKVHLLAFTASVTLSMITMLMKDLQMTAEDTYLHHGSFDRPRHILEVRKKDGDTINAMVEYIVGSSGAGIVYCLSRDDCVKLSSKFMNTWQ
jgi:superfamily II DNA helicase RecQ